MKLLKATVLGLALLLPHNTFAGLQEQKEKWILAWDLFETAAIKIQQGATPKDIIRAARCNKELVEMEYALQSEPLLSFKGTGDYKALEEIADLKAEICMSIFK